MDYKKLTFLLTVLVSGCSTLGPPGGPSGPSVGFFDEISPANSQNPYRLDQTDKKKIINPQYNIPYQIIEPGMGFQDVKSIFGEPTQIDYAGVKNENNERWYYASPYSLSLSRTGSKYVYFEMGRVVGWENL